MKEINTDSFNEVIDCDHIALVDFFTSWCQPCKAMSATLNTLDIAGVSIFSVDAENSPALAEQFLIRAVPTLVFFKGGKEIHRFAGMANKSQILAMIEQMQ